MSKRTQIVCLHEGEKGRSIDPIFISVLLKTLKPAWIRPWTGGNVIRTRDCGGRKQLIKAMPGELLTCLAQGGDTTLMVWADVDDEPNCEVLKTLFWVEADGQGIAREAFDTVVFAFARNRLENWIEFLLSGRTDETREGRRVAHNRTVADAARILAERCRQQQSGPRLPRSLLWSCQNWKVLKERMTD